MTLSERIALANRCAVVGCERGRQRDSLFCRSHLDDMWSNRLDRLPDGTFVSRRSFPVRDLTAVR